MLSNRKKIILKSIIENYSKEAKPVSSKLLTYTLHLNVSSATIRADMAELEKQGYLLKKNYNSSGRIPSFKGYNYYLNNLIKRNEEFIEMFSFVDKIIQKKSFTKEQLIKKVLELLSEFTSYTAIAIGSDILKTSKINKIDLIYLNYFELIILIVTDKGHVQHQNIVLNQKKDVNMLDIKKVIIILNDLLKGKFLFEATLIIQSDIVKKTIGKYINCEEQFIESFVEIFANFVDNNCYLSGVLNILNQPEFNNIEIIKKLINCLTKKELIKIMTIKKRLTFKFSDNIELIQLENFTIISIPYSINKYEKGQIAILGPYRMNYHKVIPLLEYLSVYLSNLYDLNN
ncbi:negative regulator of class I heat shock protein [Candidatus Phytoplasma mali]|uniref:Heat-inducible transcription repressor HrcA n=1 Tax=Phytoplasma mali (strain AT) TaxID=482235 RepID=HRCA_PHYMT|nr:heat-inducible transcriptional repressor HrcA [Candidatus Phytoplasma mali]B3QZK4.1 RecName: Full=Heat-inducible transcription repressor HrcA [Candidatus Phytoplasma mali AT]CAP18391.1 negative regulator of class I heat shock protein [Candidatus Phytoplasma mali]